MPGENSQDESIVENLLPPANLGVFWRIPLGLILGDMPRRLHNWDYDNVTDFLKEHGFSFQKELGGSHQAWIKCGKEGEIDRCVEVNFTSKSYPIKTLERMIRQSGIDKDKWIRWGSS